MHHGIERHATIVPRRVVTEAVGHESVRPFVDAQAHDEHDVEHETLAQHREVEAVIHSPLLFRSLGRRGNQLLFLPL